MEAEEQKRGQKHPGGGAGGNSDDDGDDGDEPMDTVKEITLR